MKPWMVAFMSTFSLKAGYKVINSGSSLPVPKYWDVNRSYVIAKGLPTKEFISYLGQWTETSLVQTFLSQNSILSTNLSQDYFSEKYTGLYIEKLIPTYKRDEVLKLHTDILKPIGALSYYICSTQSVDQLSHFRPFQMMSSNDDMKITYPTLVGLEIFPKSKSTIKILLLGLSIKLKHQWENVF